MGRYNTEPYLIALLFISTDLLLRVLFYYIFIGG